MAERVTGFESADAEALARYESRGYLLIAGAFTSQEVAAARDELVAMSHAVDPECDSVYYEGTVREHLVNSERHHQAVDGNFATTSLALGDIGNLLPNLPADTRARHVRKFAGFTHTHEPLGALARKPELIALMERIVGGPVREFQDMAMIKPPRGREKPWHQDHAYFNLPLETRVVGVWIALDRVTPENGCMYLLAGGHRQGPRTHFMRRDWQICDAEMFGQVTTCAAMEAGDVLIFDSKLPHGTPTNNSNEFRWAIQLHYIPQAAREVDESVRLDLFGNEGKNVSC
jgi:hypothetical protein